MTATETPIPEEAKPEVKPPSPEEVQRVEALTDGFFDDHQDFLRDSDSLLGKLLKLNENNAAFYEKLVLFDVGTIALSLTLLGQIVAHTNGGHVPKQPFEWYLCPAWFLLLISIYCSALRMTTLHNVNIRLARQMVNMLWQHHGHEISVMLRRLSHVTGAELSNISSAASDSASQAGTSVDALMKEATEMDKGGGIAARSAILCTTVALLFICVFAIKSLLAI